MERLRNFVIIVLALILLGVLWTPPASRNKCAVPPGTTCASLPPNKCFELCPLVFAH